MSLDNAEIARVLSEVADLLDIQGANPFRVRAYRRAVRTVEEQTTPFSRKVADGEDLTELPGIGKEMANHIRELVESGNLEILEQLTSQIPYTLVDLVKLPGVGPKKVGKLWKELNVETLDDLEEAAQADRVSGLAGFGAKSQEKILQAIADHRQHASRFRISDADRFVQPLVETLESLPQVERLEVAGSYRRRRETVGDIDLLAIASEPGPVMEAFTSYSRVERVEMAGDTRASVILDSGLSVDLRVVGEESYGAALCYFTGSKDHNVRLRQRAIERGLKLSEYGLFRQGEDGASDDDPRKGDRVAGSDEEEIYRALEMTWVPPELREDRGEVERAAEDRLPTLITRDDLRGDLHMHSTWSDGRNTIEEMLVACAERGYDYFALSDHSKALAMTGGLDAKKLRKQWVEIEEVQERHPEIRLLRSQEVDILADGSLDLEDEMLEQLDIVLVSVHSRFELPAAEQTERILRAVRHPEVNILCHPTGRIINRRKPFDFDLDAVLECAAENDVAVEVNSHPSRLDLKDTHLMRAKELGVKVVINTDAHMIQNLDLIGYGVEQARRAGLEAGDVLNTLPLSELLSTIGAAR